jgi:hypothetical protein
MGIPSSDQEIIRAVATEVAKQVLESYFGPLDSKPKTE